MGEARRKALLGRGLNSEEFNQKLLKIKENSECKLKYHKVFWPSYPVDIRYDAEEKMRGGVLLGPYRKGA
jgi:hypothetical protein